MAWSFSRFMISLALLDYFTTRSSANGAAKNEDDIEMKYALLGAGIGIFLVVSFVLIKIYMIKKHIYENELTVVSGTHKQKTRRDVLETWEMSACPAPFRETLPRYSIQTKPLIKRREKENCPELKDMGAVMGTSPHNCTSSKEGK